MYEINSHQMLGDQDIFGFYDSMDDNNVVLSFKGSLTTELLDSILVVVEQKLDQFQESVKIKKKVFNVLIECMQNLYHHSDERKALNEAESSVILMIAKKDIGYSVVTGNYILQTDVLKLQTRIDEINDMSREEKKAYYKSILNNGKYSSKGGGGLGIIDIARRSNEKLEYGFVSIDEQNAFFSLNVSIN